MLVRFGTYHLPVPEDVLAALWQREDPDTGYHRLELPALKRGDSVRINSGAFAGIEGVFEARSGRDRVVVLLNILGQQAQAFVPIEELDR